MSINKQLQPPVPPQITDVLNQVKRVISTELNCIEIGIIQEFDISNQSATIQLALKRVTAIFPDGTRTIQERPLLLQCPVMVLFGGNSFLSMPIAPGDNCIVLFNDREIDQWYANGGTQTPGTYRAHSISDAIAIVGIRSLQNSISDYLSDGIRLSYNSGSRISLTDDLIESIAQLFKHNGDMLITGNTHIEGGLQVDGIVTGTGGSGAIDINANITMHSGKTLSGGVLNSSNGATGTFGTVTVSNGIVTGGS